MKIYKYHINGQELVIQLGGESGKTITDITLDGQTIAPAQDEMPRYAGVIALALLQYDAEEIHDDESDVITLTPNDTQWGSPTQQLNLLNN